VEIGNEDNIGWDQFWEQMKALKQAGWKTVTLKELTGFMTGGTLPGKSFVLTFDDGRKDSYYAADPILNALDFKAVMFVIADTLNGGDDFYLSETEIKQMVDSGRWEIGSHTFGLHKTEQIDVSGNKGHALANKLWLGDLVRIETDQEYEARIEADLMRAKDDLERVTGRLVDAMALPYGDYGQDNSNYSESKEVIQAVAAKYYRVVFCQGREYSGWLNFAGRDVYMQKRISVEPGVSMETLLERMGVKTP